MKKLNYFLSFIVLSCLSISLEAQIHENTIHYGGIFNDEATATVVDQNENLYVVGNYVDSIDLDPSMNQAIHRTPFAPNAFIAKYDASGNYQWSKSINGNQLVNIRDIELDNSGNNIYVVGDFMDTAKFKAGTAPGSALPSNGVFDVFIAKYDTAGNFIWARSFGGPAPDWGFDIAVDNSDNLIVTGSFLVFTDFDPSAGVAMINTMGGSPDIFLAKFDANGNYIWAKNAGSNSLDEGYALDVDRQGNIFLTGVTGMAATFDNINIGNNGGNDFFIAKYDASGNAVWAKNFGGPAPDKSTDIKLVGRHLYVSADYQVIAYMDTGLTAPTHTAVGDKDVVFAKYDTSGAYIWSHSIGGSLEDLSTSIEVDTAGSIYLSGSFEDTMNFAVGIGEYRIASQGNKDIFMAKYDKNANLIWAHGMGDLERDRAYNIDASNDFIYLCGDFKDLVDFDPDTSINTNSLGTTNGSAFISKYSICYNNHSFDTLRYCENDSANYGAYYTFSEDGDHHLRLVDANGCDTLVTLHVEMNDTVDVRLNPGSATIFALNTTATIQWIDCVADTIIPGETSASFTPQANGNYAAIITDATSACTDTSACIPWFPIGLEENNTESSFKIYPNPVKDQLFVEAKENSTLIIYNQTGKVVYSEPIQLGKNQIDLDALSRGIYFLRLANDTKYRKLILQ